MNLGVREDTKSPPTLAPLEEGQVARTWHFSVLRSGSMEVAYLRLVDFCITHL